MEARRSKGAYLERKIKGVLRQRKDELLNNQKTLLLRGTPVVETGQILPAKNHFKLGVNSKRVAK